jgi:hypothetical protein
MGWIDLEQAMMSRKIPVTSETEMSLGRSTNEETVVLIE